MVLCEALHQSASRGTRGA